MGALGAHNALSIDVEDYFHVSNFDAVIPRDTWDAQPSRVEASTRCALQCFADSNAHGTFFILGWVAERHPELVREIADAGHEIACHGYGHQLVYDLGPERFRADIRRAKQLLEDTCGRPVEGYRAPSYSITERSLWALSILAEEGFGFDSSIFPIRHHRYGIPDFERHPVRLALDGGLEIDEYPLTTARMGPATVPIAGGAYLRFMPGPAFRFLFGREVRCGRPTVLYLHPWELDPEQPRQDVNWRVRTNHYHNLARTEARLRALLAAHAFAPMGAVLSSLEAAGDLPVRAFDELFSTTSPPPTFGSPMSNNTSPKVVPHDARRS